MIKLFENWRQYLEEEQLEEKMALKKGRNGWWMYSQLVAQAYREAPMYDSAAEEGYSALAEWLDKHFGRISTRSRFEFVPEHVYTSAKDLRSRVESEGVMYVSTLDAEHPVWKGKKGLITNTMFRAWHDWEGHIVKGKGFTLAGEIGAYNAHAKIVPRAAVPVLFTEVVGQICCFYQSGKKNCAQKAAILPHFDYINVGNLTPMGEARFGVRLNPQTKLLEPIKSKIDVDIDKNG